MGGGVSSLSACECSPSKLSAVAALTGSVGGRACEVARAARLVLLAGCPSQPRVDGPGGGSHPTGQACRALPLAPLTAPSPLPHLPSSISLVPLFCAADAAGTYLGHNDPGVSHAEGCPAGG